MQWYAHTQSWAFTGLHLLTAAETLVLCPAKGIAKRNRAIARNGVVPETGIGVAPKTSTWL